MAIAVLFGALSGVSIVVARMLNASLGVRIGSTRGTFYNYVTGLLGACLALMIAGGALPSAVSHSWNFAMYLGGVVGVLSMLISNYVTPRMSAYMLTLVIFVSQLASGLAIDALSGVPVSPGKIAGGALVLLGLLYNQRVDRKAPSGAMNNEE